MTPYTTASPPEAAQPAAPGAPPCSPAQLAALHGLSQSGARPALPAYVRQLWQRRHFITAFATARLTAQYSQAKLGQLWQVTTPLLNAAVYFLVFGMIMNAKRGMGTDVYIPFLVTGVFVFTFTQSSAQAGVRAIAGNLGLVRALHFPRAALPVSFALQQLQQLLFSMVVLVALLLGFGNYPSTSWLLVIPALVLQFAFNTGLALMLARMGAGTPDLAQLLPFLLRTWMYVSGVMYSMSQTLTHAHAAPWVRDLAGVNPVAVYIDLVRFALITDFKKADHLPQHIWALALGWAVLSLVGGFVYFWKAEERYGRG
ncbi:ABC transporter permease [Streptomyces sp. ODS28]|uniref:ABC transporter permease n=1 Tax=Streptomyces sp. ODS28 TaxID=3136688 RepID=UPI0031EE40BC